jgi:3-deoxy-D-manno-octulosonic-acid transferase
VLGIVLLLRLRRGKSREGWDERWGRLPESLADKRRPRVWVHAASVGEVMAATPILKAYRERRPDDEVILTVITPGGHEVASGLAGQLVDHVFYAPFDVPSAVKRAVRAIQPDIYVGLETELWPNLLHYVRRAGARLALVNGRLSDRSFPRYRRLRPLLRRVLANFDRILAQTANDAERFRVVGAPSDRVEVFGNAKFDQAMDRLTDEEREVLRSELRLPEWAPVLIVGSTRTTEEEQLVYQAYSEARKKYVSDLVLIHAPRHTDRAEEVEALMREAGLDPVRRSRMADSTKPVEHLILDTFGELARVYAVADVAYIGNSLLPPGGGQNLLQPLAQGVPVIYGPYMENFRDICRMAEDAGVARPVNLPDQLASAIAGTIEESHETYFEAKARALIESNRGAANRYADALVALMARL